MNRKIQVQILGVVGITVLNGFEKSIGENNITC